MKDKKHTVSLGTLYDINKEIIKKERALDDFELKNIASSLEEWFNWQIDGYAMLLCRERYDFTVFHLYEKENPNPCKVAVSELFETLKNRGKIISIEKEASDENVWEIWIKINELPFVYYLFNCDDWIIQC